MLVVGTHDACFRYPPLPDLTGPGTTEFVINLIIIYLCRNFNSDLPGVAYNSTLMWRDIKMLAIALLMVLPDFSKHTIMAVIIFGMWHGVLRSRRMSR